MYLPNQPAIPFLRKQKTTNPHEDSYTNIPVLQQMFRCSAALLQEQEMTQVPVGTEMERK
jgi:hypothetical protein